MLRFISYDIVFQEVPGEVTLAVNISNCPNRCKGCHSRHLWDNSGEVLNEESITALLDKYGNSITCFCFMGGDADPQDIDKLAAFLKNKTTGNLKTAWYSGKPYLPESCSLHNFDYIKLGPYIEQLGGLDCPTTNQRFYRIENNEMIDQTIHFTKKERKASESLRRPPN